MTDDAPALFIGEVAFAPGNPDTIYVATGEGNVGVGVLKSTNGGQSWALAGSKPCSDLGRAASASIPTMPTSSWWRPRAAFPAATARDIPPPRPPTGVLRSTDGGTNWPATLTGQATALEVDPTNSSRQYAAIADQTPGFFTNDPTPSSNGIYRSTNGGVTWSTD